MAEHAPLSFSASSRWLKCTGSLMYDRDIVDAVSSAAADAGTAMHLDAAKCLEDGTRMPGDSEEARIVNEYCVYVESVREAVGRNQTFLVEQRVTYNDLAWGTADAILISPYRLDIFDLKTGRYKVRASDNSQLMAYAYSALCEFNIFPSKIRHKTRPLEIHMHIVQPSIDWFDDFELNIEDPIWDKFGKSLDLACHAFRTEQFTFAPEESTCQWCKGRSVCAARASTYHDLAVNDFVAQPIAPKNLTTEDFVRLLPHLDAIVKWCGDVQQHCIDIMTKGEKIPGFRVTEGPTQRRWADDQKVIDALLAAGVEESVAVRKEPITIGTAEKLLGKKHPIFAEQCKRTTPRSIIVPDDTDNTQLTLTF